MSCGLRDVVMFEEAGVPAVLVASSVFADAAERQADGLGMPEARRVVVEHPIQDRTDEEMRELARGAAAGLLAALHA